MGIATGAAASATGRDFTIIQMAALVFVVCTAFSSQMNMPLWIGAIIDDYGMSRSVVGAIGAAEMAVVAIVSGLMAIKVHRFKAKPTVLIGIACLVIGNFIAAFLDSAVAIAVARILVGCGKGIVVTISFSLAAGVTHPTRAFAILNASYALFSMFFFLTTPSIIAAAGAKGAFIMLSAVSFISVLAMVWYPERRMLAGADIQNISLRSIKGYGLIAFVALIVLWIGHNAIWTFVERLGLRVELTPAEIGQILSLAAFITIAGPSLARVIDNRFGYTAPILTAMSIKVVATFALVFVTIGWVYATLVPVFLLVSLFMLPYFMGILSLADPAGRLAAAASAAMTMGSSLGSLFGGWTADAWDYEGLAWLAIGNFSIVIVLMVIVTFSFKKNQAETVKA